MLGLIVPSWVYRNCGPWLPPGAPRTTPARTRSPVMRLTRWTLFTSLERTTMVALPMYRNRLLESPYSLACRSDTRRSWLVISSAGNPLSCKKARTFARVLSSCWLTSATAFPAASSWIGQTARSAWTSRSANPFTVTNRSVLRMSASDRPRTRAASTSPRPIPIAMKSPETLSSRMIVSPSVRSLHHPRRRERSARRSAPPDFTRQQRPTGAGPQPEDGARRRTRLDHIMFRSQVALRLGSHIARRGLGTMASSCSGGEFPLPHGIAQVYVLQTVREHRLEVKDAHVRARPHAQRRCLSSRVAPSRHDSTDSSRLWSPHECSYARRRTRVLPPRSGRATAPVTGVSARSVRPSMARGRRHPDHRDYAHDVTSSSTSGSPIDTR